MEIRLDSYLAKYGICSRRSAKLLIDEARVKVNNELVTEVIRINLDKDVVLVDDRRVTHEKLKFIYYILNKPLNVLSTTADEHGRKTVLDFVPNRVKIYPVGRLDYNSTGLILLTNDGDLALKLTHPRYHVPKKYVVFTDENIKDSQLVELSQGIILNGKMTVSAEVKRLGSNSFEISLNQGLKRQIREMCKTLNLEVISLERISIGPIELGSLEVGKYRALSDSEVLKLKKLIA